MRQINSSFVSCLDLAVIDKFQNTCLDFFTRNENVCSTRQQQQQLWQQQKKKTQMSPSN